MDEDTTGKEAKAPCTRESKRETTQDFAKFMRRPMEARSWTTPGMHRANSAAVRNIKKGPESPTSQLLPIISKKCGSGDGEGRKDKGGGGGKMVCDKVV